MRWMAPLVLVTLGTPPVLAQTQQEVDQARRERDQVRTDAADVTERIDALTGEADEVAANLDVLEITISAIDSRLDTAQQSVESTNQAVSLVSDEITKLESHQGDLQGALTQSVVQQYIEGHAVQQRNILTAEDPVGWSMQQGLFELVTSDIATVQDQLRVVEASLDNARAQAETLAAAADQERETVATLAAEAAEAHKVEGELLLLVSERLERRLAEADALAEIDAELSEEIRRGEAEIARRLAIAKSKAAERAAEKEGSAPGAGEASDAVVEDSGLSAKEVIARPEEIVNVRGIEIHHSIAEQLRAMINAAEANGVILGGAGWRSTEYQIELRIQNCGSTDYLIFDAPSEACWPPTARPASSNHEAGMAVDLTAGGRAIVDQNSVAFQWLAANAPSYGFYNLWSEPWHWSIDGR